MRTYRDLLRNNRSFRLVWSGEIISFAGDWFNTLAIFAILQEHRASALAMTSIWAVKTLPIFLISPLAGILADRWDRKKILVWSNLGRALSVLVLIQFAASGSMAGIYGSLIFLMLLSGIFVPARQALTPMIVPPEHLLTANALSAATWSTMLAIGAALGGVVTEFFGPLTALYVDAASFLWAAYLLSRVQIPQTYKESQKELVRSPEAPRLWKMLRQSGFLSALVTLKGWMGLSNGAISLFPLLAAQKGGGALAIGLLYAARGLGTFTGSLIPRHPAFGGERSMRRLVLAGYMFLGTGYLVLSWSHTLLVAYAGILIAALGTGCIWVLSGTLIQMSTPSVIHGRLFSTEFALLTLSFTLSSIFAGGTIDYFGWTADSVLRVFSVTGFFGGLVWASALLIKRRRMQRTTDQVAKRFVQN